MTSPLDKPLPREDYFRSLNRGMALNLLNECYDLAIASDAPFARKFELLKLNVKLGDLEPKQMVAQTGTGFSIQIVFNDESAVSGVTIDAAVGFDADPPTYLTPSMTTDALAALSIPDED